MSKFMAGFFTCALINLLFANTPERAVANLQEWWGVLF
jgi:hypothetical protein